LSVKHPEKGEFRINYDLFNVLLNSSTFVDFVTYILKSFNTVEQKRLPIGLLSAI